LTCVRYAEGQGYANPDQHQAAEQFATFAGSGADSAAEFEADQRHGSAYRSDHDEREYEPDVEGTERESNRKVADARRRSSDQKPPGALGWCIGRCWTAGSRRGCTQ